MDRESNGSLRRVVRNAGALAISGVLAQIAFLFTEALIARKLGPDAYGVFATVFVISSISLLFIDLGLSWKIIQDGSRERAKLPILVGNSLALKSMAFVVSFLVLYFIMNRAGYNQRTIDFFSTFYLYTLIASLSETMAAANAAVQKMHLTALFQALTPAIIGVVAAVVFLQSPSLNTVAFVYIASAGVVASLWSWQVRRDHSFRFSYRHGRRMLGECVILWVSGALGNLFLRADLLILPLLVNLGTVGIFAAGYKIVDVIYKVPIVMLRAVVPPFLQQSAIDRDAYWVTAKGFVRGVTATGVIVGIALFCLSQLVVHVVFGDSYAEAVTALQILSLGVMLRFSNVALETLVLTTERHRERTWGYAIAIPLKVAVDIILVWIVGAVGITIGSVIGEVILMIMLVMATRKEQRVGRMLSLTGIPIVSGMGVTLIGYLAGLDNIFLALVSIVLLMFLLFSIKYVRFEEIRTLYVGIKRKGAFGVV